MPNNAIISTPGISTIWQKLQKNLNLFLNNLHVKGWDTSIMMSIEIDDDKVH